MDRTISSIAQAQDQFNEALTYLRAGDSVAAASICDEALKAYPSDANLLCLAARVNVSLRQFDQAKRYLEDAVRLYPDFAVAHDVVGDCLFAEGYAASAIRAYEQALRLDPTHAGVLTKIEKANDLLEKAESTPPVAEGTPARRMAFLEEMQKA